MDDKKMKTTAPFPPVGADGGQPLSQKPTPSITEDCAENNPPEKDLDEMLRQMQRFNDPAYLPAISMNDLYENVYQSRPPVIDGLLYTGAYLFVGAPKVGKSFLMAQLAYHVSTGLPLWGTLSVKGLSFIWRWRTTIGAYRSGFTECLGRTAPTTFTLPSTRNSLAGAWRNS